MDVRYMAIYGFLILVLLWGISCQGTVVANLNSPTKSYVTTDDDLPALHLPQLYSLVIKYGLAKFWNIQTPFSKDDSKANTCTGQEAAHIRQCGVQALFNVLDRTKPMKHTENDFKGTLHLICRRYDGYKQCLSTAGLDCTFPDRTIVDLIFSYICGPGKADLLTDDTGMRLWEMSRKDVVYLVESKPGCSQAFAHFANVIEGAFSVYHAHDEDAGGQTPAIKQTLFDLCKHWYIMETCIFPIYGKLCGPPAQRFYTNLLKHIKQSLVDEFGILGSDILDLARCNSITGNTVNATKIDQKKNSAFGQYIQSQYLGYSRSAQHLRFTRGSCDLYTVSMVATSCIWEAVAKIGPSVTNMMSDLSHHYDEICNGLLRTFLRCYEYQTNGCSSDKKIDFSNMVEITCKVFNKSDDILRCLDGLSVDRVSQENCGLSLSDLGNYYVFQGSMIYNSAQQTCSQNIPFQNFPDLSCVANATMQIEVQPTTDIDLKFASHCIKSLLPLVRDLIHELDRVMRQASLFFGQMFKDLCQKN